MNPIIANPTISVILPVFNASGTVSRAIDSLLSSDAPALEILAVDDGSGDETLAVLRQFQSREPRLQVLAGPHRGIVPSLNRAVAAARGAYLARMDADDISLPGRLRHQAAYLDRHRDIGLVGCRARFGGDRQACAGYAAYVDWINSLIDPADISLNRFVESPLAHPTVMFRAELAARHGGYRDGEFPEDYELWLRWLDAGVRMAKLPEELLVWSDPPDRLSRTDSRYSQAAFYRCKAKFLGQWLARHNPHHPHLTVWGAGRETRKRAEALTAEGVCITDYVDVDPRRIGQTIHGRPVRAESDLPPPGKCFVASYVGSRGARDDIRARLRSRGYVEGADFVMAA